ncbi:VOC family protein [Chloroflexi bacterium TSY]|nr:VOC family protein [Chloroflexi bacterium TSY]
MTNKTRIVFEHIHIISADPESTASWYVNVLGGEVTGVFEIRDAPQIAVAFDGITILIRGQRAGEQPSNPKKLQSFNDFVSHNEWGMDHFAFTVRGDLDEFCDNLKQKGATFSVEPHEFSPGSRLAYLETPDGVSIELVQAKR